MKRSLLILVAVIVLFPLGAVHAQNVEYVASTLWSGAHDVKVVGNYAYCAFANGLVVLDVSDPAGPAFVSQMYLQGQGRRIDVDGDFAYLADGSSAVQIINVSNPYSPTLAGSLDTQNCAEDVFVSGKFAYVADGPCSDPESHYGLEIFDVEDPYNPIFAGSYETQDYVLGVFVSGNYAFVAGPSSGLLIVNVTDPYSPTFAGSYDMQTSATDVFVRGDYAFVVGSNSLQIIDASDPDNPTLTGSCFVYDGRSVSVSGDFAYVAWNEGNNQGGLTTIDVSDLFSPTFAGHYNTPGLADGVFVSGQLAYVADRYSGLQILEISDPENPTLTGSYDTSGPDHGVFVSDQLAYVAAGLSGLQIVDLTDSYGPTPAGSCDTPDNAEDVVVSGQFAYVADRYSGLQVIKVTDPYSCSTIVGSYYTPAKAGAVFVSGDICYVASGSYDIEWGGHGYLDLLDVSDPYQPSLLGEYFNSDSEIQDVFVQGDYAYVTANTCGGWSCYGHLLVLDVSDPQSPALCGSYDSVGFTAGVFVSGNLAYVAWNDYDDWPLGDLRTIDVSDPCNLSLAGSCNVPGTASDVFVSGNYAYVTSGGLGTIDVTDPYDPSLVGGYDTPGVARNVYVQGDYTYVADTYSLMVLRFDSQTGIEEIGDSPHQLSLHRNHPDPFNASTSISYRLPEAGDVNIDIYDLRGRKVKELFKANQAAGEHRVVWDAGGFTSGIYFARLTSGSRSEMIRMTLLK